MTPRCNGKNKLFQRWTLPIFLDQQAVFELGQARSKQAFGWHAMPRLVAQFQLARQVVPGDL